MSDITYLKRLFQAYYKEKKENIPLVSLYNHREFGFIPWVKKITMIRHISFKNPDNLTNYLIDNGPRHVYSSGSLYLQPDNLNMNSKEYQGCDLLIDIDVDHFYTPCKDAHDLWWCKNCNETGKGMIKVCPKCGKLKIKTLTWICEDCLDIAKNEIKKLIFDFLIPDFKIEEKDMKIAFSGHRGYHLKIENKKIRNLSSEDRREIADYVSGNNISFEVLGLREKDGVIYGISKVDFGWPRKIINKLKDLLTNYSNEQIISLYTNKKFRLSGGSIEYLINNRNHILNNILNNEKNIWLNEKGIGLATWEKILKGIVHEIGAEIDEPVTIDVHRLIRYPGSLHGKTGFKVQELTINELDKFNPLNEKNENVDPIVFSSKNMHKVEIIESLVPETKIKGEKYGPYKLGEKIEVPHHIAVFLLCKEVAKTL